jgi:hypothetical protein
MIKLVTRKKRHKLAIAMLAPILMVVFVVGWSLALVGLADKQTLALSSINLLFFIHKQPSTLSNIES